MIDGDIFRWRYKEISKISYPYWCKSQIAILRDDLLIDTYWSTNDNFTFKYGDPKIELEFIDNVENLERKEEWCANYYDDKDIVDLNHKNSPRGNFYVRKGSKRSLEKMSKVLEGKIQKQKDKINNGYDLLAAYTNKLEALQTADLENFYI